jgi:hypothetical protein
MTKLLEEIVLQNIAPPQHGNDEPAQTVIRDTARRTPRRASVWALVAALVAVGIAVACQLSGDMGISRSFAPQIVGALL